MRSDQKRMKKTVHANIHIHVYVHIYQQLEDNVRLCILMCMCTCTFTCMGLYITYILAWQILQDHVFAHVLVCMCVFVCILAYTEGISKNNVTEAEQRIRVTGFPGQVMKVKSLVYSSELCINGNTGIRAVSLDLGWVQNYARS